MEKLVAIIDDMPEYGRRLAMYLNAGRTFPYRAVVFSAPKEAESYINNNGVYAVLASETMEKEVLDVVVGTSVKLFWLSEKSDLHREEVLYRYCSVKETERRLMKQETKKHTPVIGFYSPAGGYAMERLSREIAEKIGKEKGGKVLYLPVFPFGIYGREQENGLSEILYYFRQHEEQGTCPETYLRCGEYADVPGPVRWYVDLDGVTKNDVKELLNRGRWNTEYQAFFLAVGQFDKAGRLLLNCCDTILVPVWENEEGKKIQEEFRRQLKESGETKIYSGIAEFAIGGGTVFDMEEAVLCGAKKGGEALAGDSGRDT